MSTRGRSWWRPCLVRAVGVYRDLKARGDKLLPFELQIVAAIDAALRRLDYIRNGEAILEAADAILIRRLFSVAEYAEEAGLSVRTVGRRLSAFLNLVAEELGLLPWGGDYL